MDVNAMIAQAKAMGKGGSGGGGSDPDRIICHGNNCDLSVGDGTV